MILWVHKISGSSLEPEYQPGEYVVSARIPFFMLRPGQIVVFQQPEYGLLIKRIGQVDSPGRSLWTVGSHPYSIDSRTFGPVASRQILGRVVWHIRKPARPSRAGR